MFLEIVAFAVAVNRSSFAFCILASPQTLAKVSKFLIETTVRFTVALLEVWQLSIVPDPQLKHHFLSERSTVDK